MNYSEPVKQLLTLGELQDPIIDYSELGISVVHAQELMAMATDHTLFTADEDDPYFWAILHAWYALGKLQITEAIPVLLELNDRYANDYLFDDEFPKVFALMGSQVIPKLKDFIADKNNSHLARSNAMICLERLGQDYRHDCVSAITDFLKNATHDDKDLAGFAVCSLLELKAIESIDCIRDAFNRQCINIAIPGDIEDVEIDLGLRESRSSPRPHFTLDSPIAEAFQQLDSLFNSDKKSSATYIDKPITASSPKVGRNDPCPCGSGKKYKKCCLHL